MIFFTLVSFKTLSVTLLARNVAEAEAGAEADAEVMRERNELVVVAVQSYHCQRENGLGWVSV
jgi:hypothetical protein